MSARSGRLPPGDAFKAGRRFSKGCQPTTQGLKQMDIWNKIISKLSSTCFLNVILNQVGIKGFDTCRRVGQIGGKASACMTIAMLVGWSSIERWVVGIVIFVSTIWHLFLPLGRRDTVHRDPSSNTSKIHQKKGGLEEYFPFGPRPVFRGEL